MPTLKMKIELQFVQRLLDILKDGIQHGAGNMDGPGSFCVEQAVSHAVGNNHWTDKPRCVSAAVRTFGIRLNDREWDPHQRAKVLKRFAVVQLGSDIINDNDFERVFCRIFKEKYNIYESCSLDVLARLHSKNDLVKAAEVAVEALIELKSPGAEFLYMCDDPKPKPEHQKIVDRVTAPKYLTWGNYNAASQACPNRHNA